MTYRQIILYLRVSDSSQEAGDGLERQRRLGAELIKREGLTGIKVVPVEDAGFSGYHGRHRSHGKLGELEAAVLAGEHRNDLFICERIDRLSRQGARKALDLIQAFTDNGMAVMTWDGDRFNAGEDVSLIQDITARIKADVASRESITKADRTRANWIIRRERAAKEKKALSAIVCEPWLHVDEEGRYQITQWKLDLVQKMFELAAAGRGSSHIVHAMNEIGKPLDWSNRKRKDRSDCWARNDISDLLKNRALIGEYQPRKGGEIIEGFYPTAIDPALFAYVQSKRGERKKGVGGRSTNVSNLLTGLVRCNYCG